MIGTGTSLVEVEAITFDGPSTIDEPMGDRPTRQVTPPLPESPVPAERISTQAFVQIGAFGSRENADRRIALLRSVGIGAGFVLADTSTNPALFRVRLGPIRSVEQYDMLIEELNRLGIADPILVTD
jgi:rare lipoprotein A